MSRIAIISDPHANVIALEAVLKVLDREKPDLWVCLGDLVGYGPSPSEVIELIRQRNMICVKGNHDAGVTGELTLKHFREPNRDLIKKTRSIISNEEMEWLKSIPLKAEGDDWVAAHSHPFEPQKWIYIESAFTARDILSKFNKQFLFIGHTHKPAVVSNSFAVKEVAKGNKYLINPGSVGQSRDGDYRASCGILDTEKYEYKNLRIEYDLEPVLTGLMKLGFSRKEADHLMKN